LDFLLKNYFLKKIKMFDTKIINWLIWLVLVILWNYGYPEASPFLDVLIAVILSLLNLILIKVFKK
tara:strand:+ start:272 stop:469 length:198 start_codon:yes stop_codon:yes gene_type:complete